MKSRLSKYKDTFYVGINVLYKYKLYNNLKKYVCVYIYNIFANQNVLYKPFDENKLLKSNFFYC